MRRTHAHRCAAAQGDEPFGVPEELDQLLHLGLDRLGACNVGKRHAQLALSLVPLEAGLGEHVLRALARLADVVHELLEVHGEADGKRDAGQTQQELGTGVGHRVLDGNVVKGQVVEQLRVEGQADLFGPDTAGRVGLGGDEERPAVLRESDTLDAVLPYQLPELQVAQPRLDVVPKVALLLWVALGPLQRGDRGIIRRGWQHGSRGRPRAQTRLGVWDGRLALVLGDEGPRGQPGLEPALVDLGLVRVIGEVVLVLGLLLKVPVLLLVLEPLGLDQVPRGHLTDKVDGLLAVLLEHVPPLLVHHLVGGDQGTGRGDPVLLTDIGRHPKVRLGDEHALERVPLLPVVEVRVLPHLVQQLLGAQRVEVLLGHDHRDARLVIPDLDALGHRLGRVLQVLCREGWASEAPARRWDGRSRHTPIRRNGS